MKAFVLLFVATCYFTGAFSHHHPDHHDHGGHDHAGHKNLTEEQKAKIHADVDECIIESKVDRGLFEDMAHGREFTPTRELDCFAACVFKKMGSMTADGTVVEKPEDSDKAKECKKLTGKDECETAGKIMGCFYKNDLIPEL
uniref:Odorant-binding protein 30 n=1 Tax=Encarsia formosa TaxID=32400 RepID=A0A514TTY9_ENCFO|nr:odorant-binding protein 30 [Encarsia formosa]